MMKKCKITVLKRTFDKELAEEYGADGIGACPLLKEGQVFYADWECPEGFCNEAWKAVYQYVFTLAHGGAKELFYNGDWVKNPELQFVPAMTESDLLSSKLKQLI